VNTVAGMFKQHSPQDKQGFLAQLSQAMGVQGQPGQPQQ
jgi:hypothetical protein